MTDKVKTKLRAPCIVHCSIKPNENGQWGTREIIAYPNFEIHPDFLKKVKKDD